MAFGMQHLLKCIFCCIPLQKPVLVLLVTHRGTLLLLVEMELLHDYFEKFSTPGEK